MNPESLVVLTRPRPEIAVIQLNRPDKKNAMNLAMAREIQQHLDDCEADQHIRVVVLAGQPGCFSAGMDIQAFRQGELPVVEPNGFAGLIHAQLSKVLIAAVDGVAYGGGFEMALACDLIVASRSARFSFPETGLGLVAAQGGCARLPLRISPFIAMDWLLSGQVITAEEAHIHGVVSRLCESDALQAAVQLAEQIAGKSPQAIQAVKAIVKQGRQVAETAVFEYQQDWVQQLRQAQQTKSTVS